MNIVSIMDKLYIQLIKFIQYRVPRVSRGQAKHRSKKITLYDGMK